MMQRVEETREEKRDVRYLNPQPLIEALLQGFATEVLAERAAAEGQLVIDARLELVVVHPHTVSSLRKFFRRDGGRPTRSPRYHIDGLVHPAEAVLQLAARRARSLVRLLRRELGAHVLLLRAHDPDARRRGRRQRAEL